MAVRFADRWAYALMINQHRFSWPLNFLPGTTGFLLRSPLTRPKTPRSDPGDEPLGKICRAPDEPAQRDRTGRILPSDVIVPRNIRAIWGALSSTSQVLRAVTFVCSALLASPAVNGSAGDQDGFFGDMPPLLMDVFAPERLLFGGCRPIAVGGMYVAGWHDGKPVDLSPLHDPMKSEVTRVLRGAGVLHELQPNEEYHSTFVIKGTVSAQEYEISADYNRVVLDEATGRRLLMEFWSSEDYSAEQLNHFGIEPNGKHNGNVSYLVFQVGKIAEFFAAAYAYRNNEETCSG